VTEFSRENDRAGDFRLAFYKKENPMAEANESTRRYREFMDLMPLTLELAGLPESERGRYYNEEQIEMRINVIRIAHKAARSLVRDAVTK
jgi:hypothetical protein